MNPPTSRPPSRFIRGRGQGGGAYRPYFYFRRNGRTIPAGGRGGSTNPVRGGGNANNYRVRRGQSNADNITHPLNIRLDSSFLRSDGYAAPADAQPTVQSIPAEMPIQCPGWHLYFPQETYNETSEVAKRIIAVEEHYARNAGHYNLCHILAERCFKLDAKIVCTDESLKSVWPQIKEDMIGRTLRTLATFAAAMHKVVTIAVVNGRMSGQACSKDVYVPRCTLPHKIYVRPIDFQDVISTMTQLEDNTLVDSLCSIRGIVTAIGNVEAAATWISYKCSRCGQEQAMRQSGFYTTRPYSCKKDGCLAKKNFIEQRSSPFTRITPQQLVQVQDNSIQTPIDAEFDITENFDIELRYDLVDTLVCGQDVIINGTLKMRSLIDEQNVYPNSSATTSKIYMKAVSIIDANHLPHTFTQRDLDAISMITSEPDSFKLLAHSLAPELHGSELVKAGMLLSLFGGAGSQMHTDAEINVLLVGDPGIGKSHLLEMCANVATRATLISGKRSSPTANSLTTAIQGRTNHIINAGALNTANTGHCAIDDIDRLTSHQDILLQVMQSKIVSLPFPSIYTTMVTPTSIIAAANSLRGHYDQSRPLTENIRLGAALLQQFHLIFLIVDKSNKDLDTSLTEHIKAIQDGIKKSAAITARFAVKPKANNSMNISHNDVVEVDDDDNYDLAERLKIKFIDFDKEEELDLLPLILMKKFIAYARQICRPLLNAEAAEALKSFYMSLREKRSDENQCAVSTSHLEGLIRLSQARARIDFSGEVTRSHVRDVLCIVRHSLDDTATNDYIDKNPAMASSSNSQRSTTKNFLQMLQLRSSALGRRIFDYDEIKEMAGRVGITCGVSNLVEMVNLQGYLLKKGPNLYEVMED